MVKVHSSVPEIEFMSGRKTGLGFSKRLAGIIYVDTVTE